MMSKQHQERVETAFRFICSYEETEGFSPTIREIQECLGVSSPSSAHVVVKELIRQGRIEQKGRCPRSIRIIR